MTAVRDKRPLDPWEGLPIAPGASHDVTLPVSESYSGITLKIPLHIRRAKEDGPVVFISAALHGDEINGTGAIRQLIQDSSFQLLRGSVIFIPVLNLLGFDRHSRYLPDRRDLNRCFPGSSRGSLASRMARTLFDGIVSRSDYGIDLHTAAVRRTNYPSVRANLELPAVRELAHAFGSEVILHGAGPQGALRREACEAGCPTIVMEGGEVWKVEPAIVETATRGIKNVLRCLGMLEGHDDKPPYQIVIEKTKWLRAERGGFLHFHVKPGEIVDQAQPLATHANLLGHEQSVLRAPFHGVVLGMNTLPAVSPGEPICHLGRLPRGSNTAELRQRRSNTAGLESRVVEDLASNVLVVECPEGGQ
jgi:uncharacterized protein